MKTNRKSIQGALVAVALMAACVFSGPAKAQSEFQGKFTLPYAVQWGNAVLPAGNYVLGFAQGAESSLLAVRNAKTQHVVFEPANIRDGNAGGESVLVIRVRGRQHVVSALKIGELGETYVYERIPESERELEEAHGTQTIPVLMAKK
ncbi:MAG: hypothetical protein WBQ34_18695 [Candidatus Acidiferrales bacterium]